jgi:hypothetical protein
MKNYIHRHKQYRGIPEKLNILFLLKNFLKK